MRCLAAWMDWAVYPPGFIVNLQSIFLGQADVGEQLEVCNNFLLSGKFQSSILTIKLNSIISVRTFNRSSIQTIGQLLQCEFGLYHFDTQFWSATRFFK